MGSQNPSYTEGYCTLSQSHCEGYGSQNPSYTEGYCTQLARVQRHHESQNPSYTEGYCTKVCFFEGFGGSQNPSYTEGYCTNSAEMKLQREVSKPVIYRGLLHRLHRHRTTGGGLKTRHIQRVIARKLLLGIAPAGSQNPSYTEGYCTPMGGIAARGGGLKTRHIQRVIAHDALREWAWWGLKTRHIQRVIALNGEEDGYFYKSQNPSYTEGYCTLILVNYPRPERLKTRHIQRVIAPLNCPVMGGAESQNPSYTEGYCT